MRVVGLLLLLGGCDALFAAPDNYVPDAAPDAPVADARPLIDASSSHDEDGDGVFDGIDVCPGRVDPDQLDADGDGVGDLCDPHPNLGIDRIAYFSPLESLVDWEVAAGDWVVANNDVRVESRSGNQLLLLKAPAFVDPTVIATVQNLTPAQGTSHYVWGTYLVTAPSRFPGLPTGIICYESAPTPELVAWDTRLASGMPIAFPNPTLPVEITIQASTESGQTATGSPQCKGYRANDSTVTRSFENRPAVAEARVGLYTYQTAATFTSVTVIDRR